MASTLSRGVLHATLRSSARVLPAATLRAVPRATFVTSSAARIQASRVNRNWDWEFSTPSGSRPDVNARADAETMPSKLVDFEDVTALLSAPSSPRKPLIIDVREGRELGTTGMIPGAVHVPLRSLPNAYMLPPDTFKARLGFDMPDKDQPLLFYCKAGVRAHAAAELAKRSGWTDVSEYPGSWIDWVKRRGPIATWHGSSTANGQDDF